MLTLHLEADSHPSLVALAIKTLGIVAVDPAPAPVSMAPEPVAVAPGAVLGTAATLPIPAPRRGRPAKVSPAALDANAASAVVPAPVAPAAAVLSSPAAPAAALAQAHEAQSAVPPTPAVAVLPTVDETRAALHELSSALGMPVCVDLMKTYGADRVSTVPEARRAEFIKECKAKVNATKATA